MEKGQDIQRETKYFLQATYTFGECCKALQVDFKTFKKWLEKDNIESYNSEYDERVKYLTIEQVKMLASKHGRAWPPIQQEPETMTEATAKRLTEQIVGTARLTQELRRDQATLRAGLEEQTTLRAEIQAQADQLVTIQATIEQQEKQTNVTLEKINTSQQEQGQEQEQLAAQIEQTRTAIDRAGRDIAALEMRQQAALEQAQKALQVQLDTITATTQEQAKILGQLATRMEALQDETQRNHQAAQEQQDLTQKAIQEQSARIAALETASQEQANQLAQLSTTVEAQRQQQEEDRQHVQGMVELVETRLRAEQQAALDELQKTMQTQLDQQIRDLRAATEKQARDLTAAIQSAEQDEARDVQTITAQQEQQQRQLDQIQQQAATAGTNAQAASAAVQDSDRHRQELEQRLADLEKRFQIERIARESFAQRIEAQQQQPASSTQRPTKRTTTKRQPTQEQQQEHP